MITSKARLLVIPLAVFVSGIVAAIALGSLTYLFAGLALGTSIWRMVEIPGYSRTKGLQ